MINRIILTVLLLGTGLNFLSQKEYTMARTAPQTAESTSHPFVGPMPPVKLTILHNWLTTAYCYREKGHKIYGHLNSMGGSLTATIEGCRQIAADWHFLPRGSIVEIPKIGKCIVTDCGKDVVGQHIDIHFISLADMNDRGSVTTDVAVLRWGWAPSETISKNEIASNP